MNGRVEQLPVADRTDEQIGMLDSDRPRVLLVDDDERNLLAVANVLDDLGEVVLARSGEEALRHLLKGEFAVILLDVYMPGMDGYETAQIIRKREQTKGIPIVFLSAVNKETEHLLRGYSMGAVDYVFKPVDPVVLRSKVTVFVDLFAKTKEIERKAAQEQSLIAELLRAEQELRRAEQRQAAIIQSLPMVLYLEPYESPQRAPTYVSGDLAAICVGMAMSMGAVVLAGGAQGKRSALPHSKILIHQGSAGFSGQPTDIEIQAREVISLKRLMEEIMSTHTGQTIEKVSKDMDRDYYMTAEEAKDYGIIDRVVAARS